MFLFIGISHIKDYVQKKKKMAPTLEKSNLPILLKLFLSLVSLLFQAAAVWQPVRVAEGRQVPAGLGRRQCGYGNTRRGTTLTPGG